MCGRFTLIAPFELIIYRFGVQHHPNKIAYRPSYNVAPGQKILAVINDGKVNRIGYLRWGLIPSWAKDERIGYKMINARAESLAQKPSFRQAYQAQRCLIVADSFYEWDRHDTKSKTPYRFLLKSKELFAMAGLWESWDAPNGNKVFSCTIVTTEANPLMRPIHDRMPVLLKKEDEKIWTDPSVRDTSELNKLLQPFDATQMDAYKVSKDVNHVQNNDPHLIDRI